MESDNTTGDFNIRAATVGDTEVVRGLYAQMAPDVSNFDRDFPALLDDPNALCLVLEVDGRALGMLLGYQRASLSSGRHLVIDDMTIDDEHRRQGLGRLLVEHCVARAKERGLDCVTLACSLAKPELHRFYERLGFEHRMRQYWMQLADESARVASGAMDTPAR